MASKAFGAEARIAFHGNAHLTVHDRLYAVLFTVDTDDDYVFARFLSGRFKSGDRAEGHLIVVRINGGRVWMRLEQGLSDLAPFVTGKVAALGSHDLHIRMLLNFVIKALFPIIGRRRTRRPFQFDDGGFSIRRFD